MRQGDAIVEVDPRYFRPTEVVFLQADITKARQKLGWEPRVSFDELVKIMADYDAKIAGIEPPGEGIKSGCVPGIHLYKSRLRLLRKHQGAVLTPEQVGDQ